MPDSAYLQLLQRQLREADPLALEQQLVCAALRADSVLGTAEAQRRLRAAESLAYPTERERAAARQIRTALAGHAMRLDPSGCTPAYFAALTRPVVDSIGLIVAREVAAGRDAAQSCALRREVLRLLGREVTHEEIIPTLRTALASHPETRVLDPDAVIDSVLFRIPANQCANAPASTPANPTNRSTIGP